MEPISILLADDHGMVRAGIRALLEKLPYVEVIGEASNGREALHLLKTLSPAILLTDIAMKEMNGLELAARVTKEYPRTHVLILSIYSNKEYVWQALRAGARGYLLKDADPAELELAIRAVQRGETYLTPRVSGHVVADYIHRFGNEAGSLDLLTPRQREILQLIVEGNTTKEIARTLHISVKTAEKHRTQLMDRLDIHDVPGLVRYAIRVGLVHLEE